MPKPAGGPRSTVEAASAAGTARLRERFHGRYASDFYRAVVDGLWGSSLGIGTYLGDCTEDDDAAYVGTLRAALEHGVNLLDTAINYRCQRSERVVGQAIAAAIAAGTVARDEVVLCTKGGYLPLDGEVPATREAYQAYVQREFFDNGIVDPADVVAGGHSLAPNFLAHQLDRSRANLGVRAIDIYYLHNPEQQLAAVQPAKFRTTIRRAFAMLEERVGAGDLRWYGCATWNGLRTPPDKRDHLDLSELVTIARDVGGDDHHFRVVQAPINLAMPEAVRVPTQRLGTRRVVPLLQAAEELGVSVVASATLLQGRLTANLPAEVREAFAGLDTDAQRAIAFVRELPGVRVALVGAKTPAHFTENLGAVAPR
jgi:aryl-alcohol dehydrogenase-like predicted oxidoreductase